MTESAKKYIEEHHATIGRIDEVAVRLSVSYHTLRKQFVRETGTSLSSYLHAVRVCEARRLRRSSDLKLYAIATAVGYRSDAVLRKHWKRILGECPSEEAEE